MPIESRTEYPPPDYTREIDSWEKFQEWAERLYDALTRESWRVNYEDSIQMQHETTNNIGGAGIGTIGTSKIDDLSVTEAKIAAEAITTDKVAQAAITASLIGDDYKILELLDTLPDAGTAGRIVYLTADGKIYRDNGTAWKEVILPSTVTAHLGGEGVGTIGTTKIDNAAITTPKIAANAVTTGTLAAGAVTSDIVAANAVIADKIAANAVTSTKLASGSVTTDKLAAGAVTADKITAGEITTDKLKVGSSENQDELLSIYQGASTDQIFRIRASGLDHQITSGEGLWGTVTDCYTYFRKLYPVFGSGLDGGLFIPTFVSGAAPISFQVYAVYGDGNTAKDGTAQGAINFAGLRADPANHTYQACEANDNIFVVKTKPQATGVYQAVFILDEDGDPLWDGTSGSFQDEDDIELAKEMEDILSSKISVADMKKKDAFKKHKIVNVSEWYDESQKKDVLSRFISAKKINMLLLGSIRQLNERILVLENKIKK